MFKLINNCTFKISDKLSKNIHFSCSPTPAKKKPFKRTFSTYKKYPRERKKLEQFKMNLAMLPSPPSSNSCDTDTD